MNPLISVVVPVYNLENYLEKTLNSICTQTYPNLEIVVVNDGSSDDTGVVADACASDDFRIKVIHKENGGVTSARLRGIAEASGEWIGFVDGDDYIEPNMYERLLENALKYKADISHCGYQMVFPDRVDCYYNTGRVVQQDRITALRDLLSGNFVEPGIWNKLYRRELFLDLESRMDTSIRINEDLLMNYWLFKAANTAVFEDVCPYHYLVRKGSAANSALNEHSLWDPLRVTKILLEDAPEEVESVVYRKWIRTLINSASMAIKQDPQLIKPYRDHCRRELRGQLAEVIGGRKCPWKLKIMAAWTAVWPESYGWVHRAYSRATGHDKKYNLE